MHAKDPAHWLYKLEPREWIRAALGEFARAESAYRGLDRRGGMAGCRRAGGMAINGALAAVDAPAERYGRSYMDHLVALESDDAAPESVRAAARLLVQSPIAGGQLVLLRTPSTDDQVLDAARTVMAHALAVVMRAEGGAPDG